MVQFLRVETSDNAKTYHVGVYHVLLHHLPFSQFFLFLNFELGVFRNSLDNSKRDFGVLLHIVFSEIFKGFINVLDLIIGFVIRI